MGWDRATVGDLRVCPLCGDRVSADRDSCPSGCPLATRCNVICCPNCGYEFVEDSAVISGLARFWNRIRRKP